MKMNYVSKIQSNMKRYGKLQTTRKTAQILDGSYNSVYKGRSDNFGELREYADGDDVKDIDWKASARSRKMLVRQYIAEKKHNVMLVIDSNKRMLAETDAGEEKREVALMAAGTLACLVNQNGDYVSATCASEKTIHHFPFKDGLPNIEIILSRYFKMVTMENASVAGVPLDFILRHFQRKMIILIVTDVDGILEMPDLLLKRLLVLHDILVVEVSDGDLSGKQVYDVEMGDYLPEYFTQDKKLIRLEEKSKKQRETMASEKLKHFGIASVTIGSVNHMESKIIELLSKHKGVKK